MAKDTPALQEATKVEKGVVLVAPGSNTLRWICEDCIPSHLARGWRRAEADKEAQWLEVAKKAGVAPEGAELLPRTEEKAG